MPIRDFAGQYQIETIEQGMIDFENLHHVIVIEISGLKPVVKCLDPNHPNRYQDVEYDVAKDILKGRFSVGLKPSFSIEVVEPNKKVHCELEVEQPSLPGSWTAEDPDRAGEGD